MIRCAISLGGNLGDVSATFEEAFRRLVDHPGIANFVVSPRYRTAPIGAVAGNEFLNAAAAFETTLGAEALLDLLQQMERDSGRVRAVHWGPRTLDLDLLLYGDQIIESPRLRVPHPALWHRRFVLDPLCDVLPDAIHPVFEMTVVQVRGNLLSRPLPVYFHGEDLQSVAQTFLSVRTDRNVCATEDAALAAIVFASADVDVTWPHVVRLPEEATAARQAVTDVLTAALDEPTIS